MDAERFDVLTRMLAATGSRRNVVAAAGGGLAGLLGLAAAEAGKRGKKKRKKRRPPPDPDPSAQCNTLAGEELCGGKYCCNALLGKPCCGGYLYCSEGLKCCGTYCCNPYAICCQKNGGSCALTQEDCDADPIG